jgi:hypothetical protein
MCVTLSDLVWSGLAARRFLFGKSWFLFNLVLFLTAQSVIHWLHEGENTFEERLVIFCCRAFIYLFSMTQLLYLQLTKLWVSIKARDFIQIYCLKIPKHLQNWQDSSSLCLMMALIVMLCLEPMLWCWGGDNKMFEEYCPQAKDKVFAYSIFSMFAMFLYYGLLVDVAVFSMRVSAFVLVCGRMLEELGLFVLALAGCLLTFSASISALKHDSSDFKGIPVGVLALFKIVVRMFSAEHIYKFKKDPVVFFGVCVFIVATLVFLCNLLIAQLTCAYNSIYEDMVGFARLKRMRIVVETMSMIPKVRWERFSQGLRLDKRIEFNEGDVGLKGGIQLREPAGANPTTVDMIRRFGGSTNPENQWPEEDMASGGGDEEDRFERMEQLIQRAMKRITKGNDGGGGGGKAASSGMGGSGMGSAMQSGSASGGSIDDGED